MGKKGLTVYLARNLLWRSSSLRFNRDPQISKACSTLSVYGTFFIYNYLFNFSWMLVFIVENSTSLLIFAT